MTFGIATADEVKTSNAEVFRQIVQILHAFKTVGGIAMAKQNHSRRSIKWHGRIVWQKCTNFNDFLRMCNLLIDPPESIAVRSRQDLWSQNRLMIWLSLRSDDGLKGHLVVHTEVVK